MSSYEQSYLWGSLQNQERFEQAEKKMLIGLETARYIHEKIRQESELAKLIQTTVLSKKSIFVSKPIHIHDQILFASFAILS